MLGLGEGEIFLVAITVLVGSLYSRLYTMGDALQGGVERLFGLKRRPIDPPVGDPPDRT